MLYIIDYLLPLLILISTIDCSIILLSSLFYYNYKQELLALGVTMKHMYLHTHKTDRNTQNNTDTHYSEKKTRKRMWERERKRQKGRWQIYICNVIYNINYTYMHMYICWWLHAYASLNWRSVTKKRHINTKKGRKNRSPANRGCNRIDVVSTYILLYFELTMLPFHLYTYIQHRAFSK